MIEQSSSLNHESENGQGNYFHELTKLSRQEQKIYSRQLNSQTLSEKDTLSVFNQRVLLIGVCSNFSETLKNIIGNGTKNIYIHDDSIVKQHDIRSNYLFTTCDLNERKDFVSKKHYPFIKVLNRDLLDISYLNQLGLNSITVTKIYPFSFLSHINSIANQLSIPFIFSCQMGLSYFVFSDFGESNYYHKDIEKYFSSNTSEEEIYNLNTYNFNCVESFVILSSIFAYLNEYEELPQLLDIGDSEIFYETLQRISTERNHELVFNKQTYLKFAQSLRVELPIVAEISGAMLACEILKGVVKSFEPVNQVLFWDSLKLYSGLNEHTVQDINTFDENLFGYESLFGKEVMNRISNLKVLLVGCGAVGCEQVKNLYQMGACSGENGILYLADRDGIDITNLPRQVLFKEEDLNKNKAEQARKWLVEKDPKMKVITYDIFVNKENEHIFTEEFFDSLDVMIIAVDTIHARKYLADKAMKHNIFLVESGTKGFSAQSQCQVPLLSDSIKFGQETQCKIFNIISLYLLFTYFEIIQLEVVKQSCTVNSILVKEEDTLIYAKSVFIQFTCLRENLNYLLTDSDVENYFCLYYRLKDNLPFCDSLLMQFVVQIFNYIFYSEIKKFKESFSPFQYDENNEDHQEFVQSLFNILKKVFTNFHLYEKYQAEKELLDLKPKLEEKQLWNWSQQVLPSYDKDDIDQGNVVYLLSKLRAKAFNIPFSFERYDAIGQIGNIIPAIIESTSVAAGFALLNVFNWLVYKDDIERLYKQVVNLNKQQKEYYLRNINHLKQEETQKGARSDIYLTDEQISEFQQIFDSFGFTDSDGLIKCPYTCSQFYTTFKITIQSQFVLSLDQNVSLSLIVQKINTTLNENQLPIASYIYCNDVCIYDEDYKNKKQLKLVKWFALQLDNPLIDLASSLDQPLHSSFYFSVFQSSYGSENMKTKGSLIAQFKIQVQ